MIRLLDLDQPYGLSNFSTVSPRRVPACPPRLARARRGAPERGRARQTNFLAAPFVHKGRRHPCAGGDAARSARPGVLRRLACAAGELLRSEVMHRCEQAIHMGIAPKLLTSTLTQKCVPANR